MSRHGKDVLKSAETDRRPPWTLGCLVLTGPENASLNAEKTKVGGVLWRTGRPREAV